MIKKNIKLLLFVFIFAVIAMVYLRFGCEDSRAIDVMPKVVGSASTDSVRINFGTIDTTYYPAVLDADSLIILIYPPDNAAAESLADGGTGVFNLTPGYYQYHRRGSNATPDLGVYTVCVKAWRGSAIRGIGTCSYLVTPAGTYHYGVQDSTRDQVFANAESLGIIDTGLIVTRSYADGLNFDGNNVLADVMAMNADAIDAPAFADGAQYMLYGGAVWVDTTNGTAGAVVGVNGLPSLPCRGFVNAKSVADAIGITTFCVLGGGDQSIKATMNGYTFMGIGDPTRNKIDLNSQDVGGSMFIDLDITGIQGGTRASFVRCALEDASLDAAALQCGLRGDITLLGDRDNVFVGCASSVPGGLMPTLIFSGGSESVQFRGYSGGIHLFGMGANDTLSFEAIGGQLQIGAGVNVNAKISARGMITVTDSTAGMSNLTYTATAQYAVDSTMNAITDANKPNFKATGFATSTQGDSVTQAIADANKPNFKATGFAVTSDFDSVYQSIADANKPNFKASGFATDSDGDSIIQAIADANKPNFKATGFAVTSDFDSVYQSIADANKPNFKATGFATDSDGDSVIQAIADANKPNFRATGFATSSDMDSVNQAIADANKPNFKATGFATSADGDSVIQAIADANKPNFYNWSDAQRDSVLNTIEDANKVNYMRWTAAQRDSILNAIEDANKENFKYGGGADSVRAYLATHDSTLLELAAGGASNWSNAQRDSVLAYIDSAYAHLDSFFATTFGGASNWSNAQRDSVLAYLDSAYAHLDSFFATTFTTCVGWGAHTVTLYLLDDSDSTAVSGVNINIYDSTSGVWQAGHVTPATGIRQFSLDASTYTIHLQDPPNSITSPEYMTISADTTDTFWVTVFDPGAPPSGDQCRIWCLVSNLSGTWLSGCKLSVEIPRRYHPVTLSGTIVSRFSVSAISNDTGYVYVDPYESGELTAGDGTSTVKMLITLTAPNGYVIARTLVEIPDAASWEIEF